MATQAERHDDVRYLQPVAWDPTSRTWVPVSPLYAAQERNDDGSPRPCADCGTTRPCTHAHARQVSA